MKRANLLRSGALAALSLLYAGCALTSKGTVIAPHYYSPEPAVPSGAPYSARTTTNREISSGSKRRT